MSSDLRTGVFNALAAYFMWGLAPIYFKWIAHIAPGEILVHRIVWSFAFLIIVVVSIKHWSKVQAILRQPGLMLKLTGTAILLATNWLLFIWAVTNDHILDASLGYYINPLFSVALGVMFLGERLRRWQLVAVVLACTGVLVQLVTLGSVPVISLALAGTFGLYGLFRKQLAVDSFPGLLFESAVLLPIAIIYWIFFVDSPTANMMVNDTNTNVLLIAAGIVTTAPLICFTIAAKRLTLSAVGFFQYIGPSMMFVLATYYYNEALVFEKLLTFAFIWTALVIFSLDSVKAQKKKKQAKAG